MIFLHSLAQRSLASAAATAAVRGEVDAVTAQQTQAAFAA